MDPIQKFLDGKKTYLTALAILIVGILGYWQLEVPEFVWAALGALGLGFLRAGVNKGAKPPSVKLILPFLLPLVLMTGCVGTQALSPSQQYGIASSSVRAVVDSLKAAGENKLISDEDIVAIDPVVKQAFDSLRAMRTAILVDDPITAQWYLVQVQKLVMKILTMKTRAKEMNDGGRNISFDSNHGGDERHHGLDPGPARGSRRQARLYARRDGADRSVKRRERRRLVQLRRSREGTAGWRPTAPIPLTALPEVEYD